MIRVGRLADTSLSARALAPYRLVVCASPRYLEERGVPLGIDDLAAHECLGFAAGERSRWALEGPGGVVTQPVSGRLTANNGDVLREAALAGQGIVMQPEVLLASDLSAGRLVQVLSGFTPRPMPVHVLFVGSRRLAPKLRSFIDFMVERFGKRPSPP